MLKQRPINIMLHFQPLAAIFHHHPLPPKNPTRTTVDTVGLCAVCIRYNYSGVVLAALRYT